MIVAALNLSFAPGPAGTVVLTQGDNETILSHDSWERIAAAVAMPTIEIT
jgi:hypothetical protein